MLDAALLCVPAHAQQAPQEPAPFQIAGLKATELFALADRMLATHRERDAETLYRALAQDPDPEIRAEARFRLGLFLSKTGRNREAAVEFRALLDEKPDAARVRLELARVLAELGDESAARRELRQAQAGGLPPEVSQIVDQFANALRSRKPFGASLELALVPDSNINRSTDAQTLDTIIAPLDLSDDARAQAGLGGRIAGQAFFRTQLGPHLALVPRLSGQGEFYRKSQFDDISASALIGLEWSPGRERFQLSGGGSYRWYGLDPYARTLTTSLNWQHPLSRRAQLNASLTAADTKYKRNSLQDGALFNADLGLERAFNARSGGGITLSATRQTAADPGYANVAAGVNLVYYRELGRTTAFVTLNTRGLEADQRLFLYPERRRDLLLGASAGATFRSLKVHGFAPLIRISYERNFSTVGIYDYRRVATVFGITRAF